MRVAGYVRVSTQEQVEHGWNLVEDRRLIRERCEAHGWELVEIFDDGGRQGDAPDRPGLLAMLDRLDELDVVMVRAQDRLSRDPVIWGTIAGAMRRHGVTLHTFAGPVDIETPTGEFMQSVLAAVGKLEKRNTGMRVRQSLEARARAGQHTGGAAPFGYRWEDKKLVEAPERAAVVRRIFSDYCSGMGQRAIVRSLNDDGVPTPHGGPWRQSAISKILGAVIYKGMISFTGDVLPGKHPAIVSEEQWEKAQAIRDGANRRKGGRHPDGAHLLGRSLLRCGRCGSAMLPRKARPGVERERYVCSGRIEHGPGFCDQPSIRRELVDGPFLEHLLDGYVDFAATKARIEQRVTSALVLAREAVAEREAEVARIEKALTATERAWDAGDITARQYSKREARLTEEVEGAREALKRARDHVMRTEQTGIVPDAEQMLLDHLARLKAAVADGVQGAPNLDALRNVIGDLFESVELIPAGQFGRSNTGPECGYIPRTDNPVITQDGEPTYWLLPRLNWSAVDPATFKPTGQEIPVPEWQSYPHGFLARYCWW